MPHRAQRRRDLVACIGAVVLAGEAYGDAVAVGVERAGMVAIDQDVGLAGIKGDSRRMRLRRERVARVLEKPRGFTAEEQAALEQIVRGTKTQNAARLVGKLAPSGNGLALGGNLLAAGQTAGASLPFTAAGMGAKAFADGATARNVEVADALIRSGGNLAAPALTDAQRAIAQILNAQLGQRGQSLVRGQ